VLSLTECNGQGSVEDRFNIVVSRKPSAKLSAQAVRGD